MPWNRATSVQFCLSVGPLRCSLCPRCMCPYVPLPDVVMVFEVLGENLLEVVARNDYRGLPVPLVKSIATQVLVCLLACWSNLLMFQPGDQACLFAPGVLWTSEGWQVSRAGSYTSWGELSWGQFFLLVCSEASFATTNYPQDSCH